MCSANPDQATLTAAGKSELLAIASSSIKHGLETGRPLSINAEHFPSELQVERATFVTLNSPSERLRGCIGHLEASQPLVTDVAENAFSAAFRDPRFPKLSEEELSGLSVHISVLTPSTPLQFESEQDLLAQIRPGVDGLILVEGSHRSTFLPSVWDSLTEPNVFLEQLKRKAGLSAHYWSDSIRFERYQTLSFS